MADLAFIATRTQPTIDPAAMVEAAAASGVTWTFLPDESADGPLNFASNEITIVVTPVAAMHPDIAHMPVGPTGADVDDLMASLGHLIVTAQGLSGDQVVRDCDMASITAIVIEATDAVGAMLGHNMYFHRADVFSQLVAGNATEDRPPLPLLLSVTVAGDGNGRMSFLSHGMDRYGNEDLYVTCPVGGTGAVPFMYDTITWLFDLDEDLPTGDSIGRDESERIAIQRVASPAHPERTVIRLDLDE